MRMNRNSQPMFEISKLHRPEKLKRQTSKERIMPNTLLFFCFVSYSSHFVFKLFGIIPNRSFHLQYQSQNDYSRKLLPVINMSSEKYAKHVCCYRFLFYPVYSELIVQEEEELSDYVQQMLLHFQV